MSSHASLEYVTSHQLTNLEVSRPSTPHLPVRRPILSAEHKLNPIIMIDVAAT
jgi:hypothetical protein